MIRVASYCRVSTDKRDQANSFESQQRYFTEYIQHHSNWELYLIYADEGITGTSTKKRTQFNQMIRDALTGEFQLILTKEISRFSRNILDTIQYTRLLKDAGVGIIFMTENLDTRNPETEMLLTFMGTIAQEESRRTSVRVKWGQTRRMEQGVVFGRSLLGYEVHGGKISIEPQGAKLVQLIFHKYGIEKKGSSAIARELEAEGYHTHAGNCRWNPSHIIKILKNEKYVGDLIQKKTYTPDYLSHTKKRNQDQESLVVLKDHHEAIISRELWNTVQAELSRRSTHNGSRDGHSVQMFLSGKIRCGCCGSIFICRRKKKNDGTYMQYWGCSRAARKGTVGCSIGKLLREDDVRYMLQTALECLKLDHSRITNQIAEYIKENISNDTKRLESELQQLIHKKVTAIDACISGLITEKELAYMKEQYDRRIHKIDVQLVEKKDNNVSHQICLLLCGEMESDRLYSTILEEITVFSDKHVSLRLKGYKQVFHFDYQ